MTKHKFFLAAYDNHLPIPRCLATYALTARDVPQAKMLASMLTDHKEDRFAVRLWDERHTLPGYKVHWGFTDLDKARHPRCKICGDEVRAGLVGEDGAICEECERDEEHLVVIIRHSAVVSVRLYAVKQARLMDEGERTRFEIQAQDSALEGYYEEADCQGAGLTRADLDVTLHWCPREAL